jgi:hypothetical protein
MLPRATTTMSTPFSHAHAVAATKRDLGEAAELMPDDYVAPPPRKRHCADPPATWLETLWRLYARLDSKPEEFRIKFGVSTCVVRDPECVTVLDRHVNLIELFFTCKDIPELHQPLHRLVALLFADLRFLAQGSPHETAVSDMFKVLRPANAGRKAWETQAEACKPAALQEAFRRWLELLQVLVRDKPCPSTRDATPERDVIEAVLARAKRRPGIVDAECVSLGDALGNINLRERFHKWVNDRQLVNNLQSLLRELLASVGKLDLAKIFHGRLKQARRSLKARMLNPATLEHVFAEWLAVAAALSPVPAPPARA